VVVDSSVQITEARLADWRGVGERRSHGYKTLEEYVSHYRLRPGATTAGAEIIRHIGQYGGRQFEDGAWRHKFDRDVYAKRDFIDGLACWDRIKIPSLLVKGGLSDRITPQLLAEVRARCPQVELAEVPHSGHHVTLDNPAGFVHAVDAFLTRHRPST
jgi:pimeloyl-ACP methyl ester carboxylesterase